jgi:ribonuclease HI/probable phosphoglycerate mutase
MTLEKSWKDAGYGSRAEAAAALDDLARSLDARGGGAAAETARPSRGAAAGVRGGDPARGPEHAVMYVDGASRGNPGPASVAAVLYLPTGEELYSAGKKIGTATNNVAEYRAVVEGMRLARTLGVRALTVRLDSELVMKQLTGAYRIKNAELAALAREVADESRHFTKCSFEHVPREENRAADRIANEALNRVIDP